MNKLLITLLAVLITAGAAASDEEVLTSLLTEFLDRADDPVMHERFWAEDLVYTSSSGLRFGKSEIMDGFAGEDAAGSETPLATYGADDVRVRQYDEVAVVTFRLLADVRPAPGKTPEHSEFFNTGTFVKRDGEWRAVAWQATKIPDTD